MLESKSSIIGYSEHAYVVIESAIESGLLVSSYTDLNVKMKNPFGLTYLGSENDSDFFENHVNVPFIFGIGSNPIRNRIAKLAMKSNVNLLNVIDVSALVSIHAEFGVGNYIGKRVAVNAFATIGNYCILNTGCIVEHECSIADGVHIAPGAVLCGNVLVGEQSFVGAGSVIKQGVRIGANVTVGAGSVVIKDIPDHSKIVGNPTRFIY